jgi:hypothetical protein
MSRELIERLRVIAADPRLDAHDAMSVDGSAFQLEQQAAEIERLRAALRAVYNAESRPEARAAIDAAMSTQAPA